MTESLRRTGAGLEPANATGAGIVPRFRTDSRFHLTVIATTREGTLAALKTAATLSKSMGAPITLAMIEVLRLNLPLDLPRFMIEFFEQRAFALISDAGIRDQEVTIQIWFCRDRKKVFAPGAGSADAGRGRRNETLVSAGRAKTGGVAVPPRIPH